MAKYTTRLLTAEIMRKASDEELLALYNEVTARNATATFKEDYGTDYSWSVLTRELAEKGYALRMCKVEDTINTITYDTTQETTRTSMTLSKRSLEKFRKITDEFGDGYIFASVALERFADEFDKGNIEINISKSRRRK